MVRQLNDEILDVEDDINNGIITLPWLYALEEKPGLRKLIEILWEKRDKKSLDACLKILKHSSGRKRAMEQSLELLSRSMNITMECFRVEEAFEVTLLHNVRLALLNWLEKVKYERNPEDIYKLLTPQEIILDANQPIKPFPGSGVIVFNSSNRLLMTLFLKRGMLRWELPAGVSKNDESLEETAKRETLEETGKKIEVGDVIASCWHYSRILNKGWMGLFFKGNVINENEDDHDKILIATQEAFAHNKFNIHQNPELYRSVNFIDCDFEELRKLCEGGSYSTVHESEVASGFVDWKKIPDGRIHPLHKKLLEALDISNPGMQFLSADADEDINYYDKNSRLYFQN
jgi:8-oxo-dGTP pyrophosphatase MutT (NUDIX family)